MRSPTATLCVALLLSALVVACASEPNGERLASDSPARSGKATSPPSASESKKPGGHDRKGEIHDTDNGFSGTSGESVAVPIDEGDHGDAKNETTAIAPAPGSYVYDQTGFQEFCQASCDRSDLPSRQKLTIAIQRRGDGAVALTTESRPADGQRVLTSMIYTDGQALITEVYASFTYEGFTIAERYAPQPAVTALHFPLSEGASWSGTWEGDVAGRYQVNVLGEATLDVSGHSVSVYKIQTSTTFYGEYDGRADVTAWIDPSSRALVASDGEIDLSNALARYHSRFSTRLASGPGQ